MSKRKKRSKRNGGKEKPNLTASVKPGGRARLVATIASVATVVILVVVWIGLHPSGATSGTESASVTQKLDTTSNVPLKDTSGGPSIHFPEPSFDFGNISQGDKVTHTFVVQNTGDEPLKLIKAKGSWGCTAAVLTETDIPPGGEGKIEVTFNTGRKKGKQKKTITVESNDPAQPKATLHVSALIEVEFGFEAHSLDMGRIRKGESVTKTAILLVKDPSKRDLLELKSAESNITVSAIGVAGEDPSHINVEVTLGPDMPPGRLNESITASLPDNSYPAASLRISGVVVGNVQATPERLRFSIDTSQTTADLAEQRLQVVSTQAESTLGLLGVEDTKNLLTIEVDTTVSGKEYVVRARPNTNALALKRNMSGEIRIRTNDPEQPEVRVRYNIVVPRR